MPYLIVVILILIAVAVIAYRYRIGPVAILIGSIVLGLVSYFIVGIGITRYSGVGRFYSLPFGQDRVRDSDILMSVVCWIIAWAVLMYAISSRSGRSG
ncbi:MAG TPA: hypothetical protein VNS63_09755 [Blastocatellia bacterium]|nr:hypothetical protein [Blastocatellia bacterium]